MYVPILLYMKKYSCLAFHPYLVFHSFLTHSNRVMLWQTGWVTSLAYLICTSKEVINEEPYMTKSLLGKREATDLFLNNFYVSAPRVPNMDGQIRLLLLLRNPIRPFRLADVLSPGFAFFKDKQILRGASLERRPKIYVLSSFVNYCPEQDGGSHSLNASYEQHTVLGLCLTLYFSLIYLYPSLVTVNF
jgi:hypothetical protein